MLHNMLFVGKVFLRIKNFPTYGILLPLVTIDSSPLGATRCSAILRPGQHQLHHALQPAKDASDQVK